ncbi:unnamed protein product [Hydatigera taeniaeformis]|uniref:Histone deacetylase domain-containing protein n=1 Tax=Hydatigena taeniaeformis TaxID=6205 RepID=A0A0R3WS13_HYDTA|nr:unnamed protein product [Hydatigera taeniaeformis]
MHIIQHTSPIFALRTALLFDPAMLSHVCLCPHGNNPQVHPEHPLRIISVLERIASSRLQIPRGLLSSTSLTASPDQESYLALSEGLPLAFFCHWMRARMATRVCVYSSIVFVVWIVVTDCCLQLLSSMEFFINVSQITAKRAFLRW